jgi:opacity protein-like surface antigen
MASAAHAWDGDATFAKGSFVLSPEVSYGHQFDLEHKKPYANLEFANIGVRFGWLPFGPAGPGPLHGALEVGLEPLYQQYINPNVYFAGLGLAFRYHVLSLGRLVPYVELAGFAGGTNLKIAELRSDFTFLLWGGPGLEYFVTDRTALYLGYRYEHVSNGNTSKPNRGFESNAAVVGVSFFFE